MKSRRPLGMKEDDVKVNVTLLGGGFGRKSKCDFALEAAILSKAMGGTPVKVVWTREDDIHHSFYHSVSYQHVTAGLDKNNKVVAWRHRSVSPSLMSNFMPDPKRESSSGTRSRADRHAIRRAQPATGNRRGRCSDPHRLVPFGQQHSARVRHAIHGGGTGGRTGQGSEGLPARDDRTAAHRRSAQDRDERAVELRRSVGHLSGRYRPYPPCRRARRQGSRVGSRSCPRAMAWASRFNAAS